MPSGFLWCLRSSFDLDKEVDENVGVLLDEYELEQSNPELNELMQYENMSNSDDEKRQLLKYLSLLNKERKEFREQVIRLTQKLFLMEKSAVLGINWKEIGSSHTVLNLLKNRARLNSELLIRINGQNEKRIQSLLNRLSFFQGEMRANPEFKNMEAQVQIALERASQAEREKEKIQKELNSQKVMNEKLRRGLTAMALADPRGPKTGATEERFSRAVVGSFVSQSPSLLNEFNRKKSNPVTPSRCGPNELSPETKRQKRFQLQLEELEISKSTFPLTS